MYYFKIRHRNKGKKSEIAGLGLLNFLQYA